MANRTKFTINAREKFLSIVAETGNISKGAKAIGISRRRMYELRAEDPEFAAEWDEAVEIGTDALEEEARRRAYEGTDKPVFYQGVRCGVIREYSDALMTLLLKAHRPDKYKDRASLEHSGEVKLSIAEQILKAHERRNQ